LCDHRSPERNPSPPRATLLFKETPMTRIIATVLAACAMAAAGSASAQTARIQFGDLDLASTEGAAAFEARVDAAARQFCRQATRPAARTSERAVCERAVRDEAFAQLPSHAQVRYAVSRLPVVG